jgi:hypothetical protein
MSPTKERYFDLILTFKILTHNIDLNAIDFFRVESAQIEEENGSVNSTKIFPLYLRSDCRTNTQLNTLAHRIYKDWNELPNPIRISKTVSTFKKKLKKFLNV